MFPNHSRRRVFAALLALFALSTLSGRAQPATPQRVVTDTGGGNAPGITGFELHRDGLYWWKSGGQINEITQREGTLAINASLGIRAPVALTG